MAYAENAQISVSHDLFKIWSSLLHFLSNNWWWMTLVLEAQIQITGVFVCLFSMGSWSEAIGEKAGYSYQSILPQKEPSGLQSKRSYFVVVNHLNTHILESRDWSYHGIFSTKLGDCHGGTQNCLLNEQINEVLLPCGPVDCSGTNHPYR